MCSTSAVRPLPTAVTKVCVVNEIRRVAPTGTRRGRRRSLGPARAAEWRRASDRRDTERTPFGARAARAPAIASSVLLPSANEAIARPGTLLPWPAVLLTWGPGTESSVHAHHCWHLVVGLDRDVGVRASARGPARSAPAVLTAPDVPHAIDARGAHVAVLFVDPESDAGERLLASRGGAALELVGGAAAEDVRALLAPGGPAARDPAGAVARVLSLGGAPVTAPRRRHPAVRRVLRHLREAPPEADTSLEALAAMARLSPGRFMHAFTETVGVPLRPYLRWLKLERAGAALAAGAPPGEAAHAAGFADAAHMTRTFRRMFGVTPSDLRRRSQSVQDR